MLSDNKIADMCAVSQPFVGKVRKALTYNGYKFPEKRTTSNGRTMDVTKIGSNRDHNPQQAEASVDGASENDQQAAGTTEVQAAMAANPAAGHPPEETPPVVNPETETGQVEAPESVVKSQSEDTALQAELETEVNTEGNDEATEEASEEASPNEGDEALPQEPETALLQVDEDIPTLKAKVTELQEALQAKDLEIQEKDRVIEDLEAKILAFEKDRVYYERQLGIYEKEELERERAKKSRLQASEAMFRG